MRFEVPDERLGMHVHICACKRIKNRTFPKQIQNILAYRWGSVIFIGFPVLIVLIRRLFSPMGVS
jgi:hypothetical protein